MKNLQLATYFLKIFCLFIPEKQRERQRHRQREKLAPGREPDVGLDPESMGSCPEPGAGAQPLSHPGIPTLTFKTKKRQQKKNIYRTKSPMHTDAKLLKKIQPNQIIFKRDNNYTCVGFSQEPSLF